MQGRKTDPGAIVLMGRLAYRGASTGPPRRSETSTQAPTMNLKALPFLTSLLLACASSSPDAAVRPSDHPVAEDLATTAPVSVSPQFYAVRGNGTAAFLFGTVHLSDHRTRSLPTAVEAAFAHSDALYVEMKPGMVGAMQMLKASALPEGTSLDVLVGEETWRRMGDRYEGAGRPRSSLNTMKKMAPWVVLSGLPFLDDDSEDVPALDRVLSKRADEANVPVYGLETVSEQLKMFTDMTLEDQATWLSRLLDTLDEYDAAGRHMGTETLDAWAAGDAESLYALREQIFTSVPGDPSELERKLLWDRNERFAEGIDRALRESPQEVAFVAVGAMHLPNPPEVDAAAERAAAKPQRLGLAELLRLRGYSVKRIDPETGVECP